MKLREVREEISRLMSESGALPDEERTVTLQRLSTIQDRLLQIKLDLSLAKAPRGRPDLGVYKRTLGRYVTAARDYCAANAEHTSFGNKFGNAVKEITGPKPLLVEIFEAFVGVDPDDRRVNRSLVSESSRLEAKWSRASSRTSEIARELDLLTERISSPAPKPRKRKSPSRR